MYLFVYVWMVMFICLRFNGYVFVYVWMDMCICLRFDGYVFVYVWMDMYLFMFGWLESRDMMERVVVRVYGY